MRYFLWTGERFEWREKMDTHLIAASLPFLWKAKTRIITCRLAWFNGVDSWNLNDKLCTWKTMTAGFSFFSRIFKDLCARTILGLFIILMPHHTFSWHSFVFLEVDVRWALFEFKTCKWKSTIVKRYLTDKTWKIIDLRKNRCNSCGCLLPWSWIGNIQAPYRQFVAKPFALFQGVWWMVSLKWACI
jgi:hypothetical protein